MNKLVYLFELDSVNQQRDADAFRAVFREIVHNGNCIAVSMNQLTDSPFFAHAIENAQIYPLILDLFEIGALRVSLYGEYRTASQYVQTVIERCLTSGNDSFIFSILPVSSQETWLLEAIRDALRFSDLSGIQTKIACYDVAQREKLSYIERFVNMILKLSVAEVSSIPAKKPGGRDFVFFLNAAIRLLKTSTFTDEALDASIKDAIFSLEKKSDEVHEGRNNRSNWINAYKEEEASNPMAISIIHYCYNYTVEDSIDNVCKHYNDENFEDSFLADLKKRIQKAYEENHVHNSRPMKKQQWEMLVRFAEYRTAKPLSHGGVYENTVPQKRLLWKTLSIVRAIQSIAWAIFYASLFFAVEWAMGWIEDTFAVSLQSAFSATILNILIFSMLGFLLGGVLRKLNHGKEVPDIFKCIADVFWRIWDCMYILFRG